MQFRSVIAAALVAAYASAENGFLEVSYPRVCGRLCGPVVTVSQNQCLGHGAPCICGEPNMKQLVPACQACARNQQNSQNGVDFFPSISYVLKVCGFASTTVTTGPAATNAPVGIGAVAAAMAAAVVL